jgi:acetyl esterase
MPIDKATAALLADIERLGDKPISEMTPEEARNRPTPWKKPVTGADVARVYDETVSVQDGAFAVRVIQPHGTRQGVIVYYHGGGWVLGTLDAYEALGRNLAAQTHCTVLVVDYRLAPEYRFPTAVEDAYAALLWAVKAELSDDPAMPLIVAGDSAGGNLATVVARRARNEHHPEIGLQVLIYPITDADFERPSYVNPDYQLLLTRAGMQWFWHHYLPDDANYKHPDASPLRARSLADLPPALVITAEYDVLCDEGEAYAERLRTSGVPVTLTRYPGQIHGFFSMIDLVPAQAKVFLEVTDTINHYLIVQKTVQKRARS